MEPVYIIYKNNCYFEETKTIYIEYYISKLPLIEKEDVDEFYNKYIYDEFWMEPKFYKIVSEFQYKVLKDIFEEVDLGEDITEFLKDKLTN